MTRMQKIAKICMCKEGLMMIRSNKVTFIQFSASNYQIAFSDEDLLGLKFRNLNFQSNLKNVIRTVW